MIDRGSREAIITMCVVHGSILTRRLGMDTVWRLWRRVVSAGLWPSRAVVRPGVFVDTCRVLNDVEFNSGSYGYGYGYGSYYTDSEEKSKFNWKIWKS